MTDTVVVDKATSSVITVIAAGPQGAAGTGGGGTGADGDSAYEVAVANGFVGDESAWLASLVGADGQDGTNGIDGTNGTDGADGTDGVQSNVTQANGGVAVGNIVRLTQVAYDAIVTKDPDTLYFIEG